MFCEQLSPLSQALTNYTIGTAFSFIVFQKKKNNSIKVIQILSTNTRAQKIIDSLFYSLNLDLLFAKLKNGNFCLPIFLGADSNDLVPSWDNNTYENISLFAKNFKMPGYTIMLQPFVVGASPPIIN